MSSQVISKYMASAAFAMALLAAPLAAFAQQGYGGEGGPIGLFGRVNGQALGGQVLGASAFNFTELLKLGLSGDSVTELQKILIAQGFLDIPEPTGYFGAMTEAAVKAFQSAHGLPPVGFVGPATRALLNKGITGATSFGQLTLSQEERDTLLQSIQSQLLDLLAKIQALL